MPFPSAPTLPSSFLLPGGPSVLSAASLSRPVRVVGRGITRRRVRQNDTRRRRWQLVDGGPVDLTDVSVLRLLASLGPGQSASTPNTLNVVCAVDDADDAIVAEPASGFGTLKPALYVAEFEATYSDGTIETYPGDGTLLVEVRPDLG